VLQAAAVTVQVTAQLGPSNYQRSVNGTVTVTMSPCQVDFLRLFNLIIASICLNFNHVQQFKYSELEATVGKSHGLDSASDSESQTDGDLHYNAMINQCLIF
jgi:hypothetical protein